MFTTTSIHNNPTHKSNPKFFFNPVHHRPVPVTNHHACCFLRANPNSSSFLRTGTTTHTQNRRSEMDFVVYNNEHDQFGDNLIPLGNLLNSWQNWIPGILVTIILPFFANKWGPFANIKEEVDMVEETVVKVADKVEEVAEQLEKVVEDISDDLPEGGKFKDALTFVDNVAKEAAKDAQLAEDIINKVEEVEKDVDSLVDSIADSDESKPATPKLE